MDENPYQSPREAGGGPPVPDVDAPYRPFQRAIWGIAFGLLAIVVMRLVYYWAGQ